MSTPASPNTTLLVMDMQNALVARMEADDLLDPIRSAVKHARSHEMPVVFVKVAFRDGHPEIVRSNPAFAGAVTSNGFLESSPDTQIHPGTGIEDHDVVVTKRRVSAFCGTDLAEVLRGRGATELVMCGIATSGVILSTVRQASDLDYSVTVLGDACKDGDPEVHQFLLERILPRQSRVTTVDGWISGS
jgi:nicotinamidase-related amidase